jgi:hypothetical protein
MINDKTPEKEKKELIDLIDTLEINRALQVKDTRNGKVYDVTAIRLHGDRVIFEFTGDTIEKIFFMKKGENNGE